MTGETWRLGASELSRAYRAGKTNPVEVVDQLLSRIEKLNPGLNAYVALSPDLSAQAEESASRLKRGAPLSPLDGVPIALKDNLVMRGLPATWGSDVFTVVRKTDELPVRRLRDAGAILVGKTNCPEFAVEG
uniref:amidase family protein n=1 Tax=Roseibium sp. TaxID=1936156 RepID=UPI003D13BDFB